MLSIALEGPIPTVGGKNLHLEIVLTFLCSCYSYHIRLYIYIDIGRYYIIRDVHIFMYTCIYIYIGFIHLGSLS